MERLFTGVALGAALLAAGLAGGAVAQTPDAAFRLTLEAALRAAETRSHALEAQDAATRSARDGRGGRALARPDAAVDRQSAHRRRESFSLTGISRPSVRWTQTLTREGKRQARSARFEREGDAAQAMRSMQLTALRRQTAQAWFDRYYRQQMVDLLARQRDEAALQIEAATAAYRAGRGAKPMCSRRERRRAHRRPIQSPRARPMPALAGALGRRRGVCPPAPPIAQTRSLALAPSLIDTPTSP
jgi:hypothetical protein